MLTQFSVTPDPGQPMGQLPDTVAFEGLGDPGSSGSYAEDVTTG